MSKYRVCVVCGKPVNIDEHHVYYHKPLKHPSYYLDDGTPVYKPSKRVTYEHVECSDII